MPYLTISIINDLYTIIIYLQQLVKKDVIKCRYNSKININNITINHIKE